MLSRCTVSRKGLASRSSDTCEFGLSLTEVLDDEALSSLASFVFVDLPVPEGA